MSALDRIAEVVGHKRVYRAPPPGMSPLVEADDEPDIVVADAASIAPDGRSGWTFFATYQDSKGAVTQRRLSLKRIDGMGVAERVVCYCHERHAIRSFRIDRFVEVFEVDTGEVREPVTYFEQVRLIGKTATRDQTLHDLLCILVFLAECDDDFHPLEHQEILSCLSTYVLRFGGSDQDIERAERSLKAISVDTEDFVGSLKRIENHRDSAAIFRLVHQAMNRVIAADGLIADEEHRWLIEIAEMAGPATVPLALVKPDGSAHFTFYSPADMKAMFTDEDLGFLLGEGRCASIAGVWVHVTAACRLMAEGRIVREYAA